MLASLVVFAGVSVTEAKELTLREVQAIQEALKVRGG